MDLSKKTSESNQYAFANIPDIPQDCVGDINGTLEYNDLLVLISGDGGG